MTEEEKNQLIAIRLRKSKESLLIAEEISEEHTTFSINRYYYALFYAVSAMLVRLDADTKTHKGVITAFNRLLVKTGTFSRDDGRLLIKVFQWRTKGDYDDFEEFTVEDVESIRQPIKILLEKIDRYLNKNK